jgi:protocatechuate 3,4-dioxygenase beta subunit
VSLSGLLAGCGGDDSEPQQATTSAGTTSAGTTSVRSPTRLTAEQFDSSATCAVATELTEGPFYFDVEKIRSDLREDREGTLLRLGVRVRDAGSCEPIESAIVDVWHCDASGSYSETGETYLRGAQATNSDGITEFRTIYPGWYPGRTTHIHLKVHLDRTTLLTTQLFTTREYDDRVYAAAPYNERSGRDTFNEDDGIYVREGEMTMSMDGGEVLGLITLDVQRS